MYEIGMSLEKHKIDSNFCIVMRFSFLGKSGWKSDFSRDPEMLFEESRLRHRLRLLKEISIRSLLGQTDKDFHLFILTSSHLPTWALYSLQETCSDAFPDCAFTITPASPSPARKPLRLFTKKRYGTRPHVQITLDDDDALASDFIEVLRSQVDSLHAEDYLPKFFTFPSGYGLVQNENNQSELYLHHYPYINLGLSMVLTADQKNILAIDHKGTPKKYGCLKCNSDTPMFVRTVHGANDSRVAVGPNWKPISDPHKEADIIDRFPWLLDL